MSLDSKTLETSIPESTSQMAELPSEPAASTESAKEASPLPDLKHESDKLEPQAPTSPEPDAHPAPPTPPAFKPRGSNSRPVIVGGGKGYSSGKPK